jgi:hypothetical protein
VATFEPVQPDLASPDGACGRDPLIAAIATFLARDHAAALEEIRESLGHEIDDAGPEALAGLGHRLAHAAADWSYYPSDPLARRIHHALAARVLRQEPELHGTEHLAAVAGHPAVIVANHLSYSDANLLVEADGLRAQHRGSRQRVMDTVGFAIAANLPPRSRGVYGSPRDTF